ncbi:MAG: adenylate/guanylate cyclase domain-containing protein, partial [Rubrivivax sp.]
LVAGHVDAARVLALQVRAQLSCPSVGDKGSFWHEATCGEVALILGEISLARDHYANARAIAPRAWGDLHAARCNAEAVLQAQGLPTHALADCFPRVSVVAFTGHMVDRDGRESPRFPPGDEHLVARAIDQALAGRDALIGVAGAAWGADILFREAVPRRGGETCVVLPHGVEAFRGTSVVEVGGPAWGARFDAALAQCSELTLLSDHPGEDLSYQFQGAVMAGLCRLKAQSLGGEALGLAYWDGAPGGVGGTAMVIQEWERSGLGVQLLPWQGMVRPPLSSVAHPRTSTGSPDTRAGGGQRVVSMLFADAVGFSKLGERQVRAFVQAFWGRVAQRLQLVSPHALLSANTWGDGLFLVFSDTVEAATLALTLAQLAAGTDWAALGLRSETNLRVALHAGPVYELDDPVTGRPGFAGTHISRAARMEPVTPPGQVYVSEAFAALLALDDRTGAFRCEYMGSVPLAKDYGRMRTYRLSQPSLPCFCN